MMPPHTLAAVQQFLQSYCAETDDTDELVGRLEGQAMMNARPLWQGLKDIESLLQDPPADDMLLHLVLHEAQIQLEVPTADNARAWLTWLAAQIRREINENLLPFQPIRARLRRHSPPSEARFPHDLWLYPTDDPQPEYGHGVWEKNIFYRAFMQEWDGQTCPTCQTQTVARTKETKYAGETRATPYNTTVYYDVFAVYRCTHCQLGWTERSGSEHFVEVDFPE